jgi:hypothetical protein
VAQVVEHLPSKYEAPVQSKKERKKIIPSEDNRSYNNNKRKQEALIVWVSTKGCLCMKTEVDTKHGTITLILSSYRTLAS